MKIHSIFQNSVSKWIRRCFSESVCVDPVERNRRFIEEALELVQANGLTEKECEDLVKYVFNRPVGEIKQEVGGVMVTLAALCDAAGIDMQHCGDAELFRISNDSVIEVIRNKQRQKSSIH